MYYIGVDLGGTNVAIGIMDESYQLVRKGSTPTPANDPEGIVQAMADLCSKLVKEAGISFDDVAYAGIASPGIVDREAGEVVYANNINFKHFPLSKLLMDKIPLKAVYLENDANAAALGEAKAGAARGTKNSVMITLGTGVGGGIIIDGKVYMGSNCAAGELGHIVIEKNGYPCTCGRKGCWEAYSSATGLIRMTKEKLAACPDSKMHERVQKDGKVSGRTAFDMSREGDKAAQEVVDTYISYLACGIGNLINIFQPEILVIGGGISGEKENLLAPLRPLMLTESYGGGVVKATELKIAELGNDAGIIGAACLGM
ncbi:MAG: ROK family protein [Clostridia bacterium]|nr:ROK family protein [Clostridia bacterium]